MLNFDWHSVGGAGDRTEIAFLPEKTWSRATGFAAGSVICRVEPNLDGVHPIRTFIEIDWLYPLHKQVIVDVGDDIHTLKGAAEQVLRRILTIDAVSAHRLRSASSKIIPLSGKEKFDAIQPGRFFVGKKRGDVRKVLSYFSPGRVRWCDHIGDGVCSLHHMAQWSVAEVLMPEQMAEIELALRKADVMETNYLLQLGQAVVRDRLAAA